jgi:prepilin-type N-terminal cleavage/methylation domain-containing protein
LENIERQYLKMKRCFTLIELLIVVAIIAILAAIAVPNFLEAQTRSKIARISSDMRTAATGLEAYYVDHNKYPFDHRNDRGRGLVTGHFFNYVSMISTPVAYLTSGNLPDPFYSPDDQVEIGQKVTSFRYFNYGYGQGSTNWGDTIDGSRHPVNVYAGRDILPTPGYCLRSYGPDRQNQNSEWLIGGPHVPMNGGLLGVNAIYDATNGTISLGDLTRIQSIGGFNVTPQG